jgi:hypothetical protein
MECPICFREWSDPGCLPRSLHCGHSFCDDCLTGIFLKKKLLRCPTCDDIHKLLPEFADSKEAKTIVASLPKNFCLIAVLNEKSANLPTNNPEKKRTPEEEMQYEFSRYKGMCKKHELALHFYVVSNGAVLCDKCLHDLPKESSIQIIPSVSFVFL